MSKTFFLALALSGLAACGSDSKPQAATTHNRAVSHATRSRVTSKKSKSKAAQRTATRRDATNQKNPLTNH